MHVFPAARVPGAGQECQSSRSEEGTGANVSGAGARARSARVAVVRRAPEQM